MTEIVSPGESLAPPAAYSARKYDETSLTAREARPLLLELEENIQQIIRGKQHVVRMSLVGLLAGGHLLFEDVPGVGKTTLAQCIARSVNLSFQRIQATSDLLPSDILGVMVYDTQKHEFSFRPGPIFANLVLVDEINRTTPKTQSALLEAMNTAEVSIERQTFELPTPFMVIATQNPIESHGTFPLPTSQLDRFVMRLHVGFPSSDYEREILTDNRRVDDLSRVRTVLSGEQLSAMQNGVRQVRIEESVLNYIVSLLNATRNSPMIEMGASTRAGLGLRNCARAYAYLHGRDFCTPDDVKAVGVAVLAHRVGVVRDYDDADENLGTGTTAIRTLLDDVPVPI